jgi:hypothetical protein
MAAGWNKGKHWSAKVKQKISQTMKLNHRMHSWTEEELHDWSINLIEKRWKPTTKKHQLIKEIQKE